jgi:hypothetical protein
MVRVSTPAQDLVSSRSSKQPFRQVKWLKAATNFPGQKRTFISRLKESGLRAPYAVMAVLTDELELHSLASADSSVDGQWGTVMFCDECTLSSADGGRF